MQKLCVFIHTNHKQWLGALVSKYSFQRNSKHIGEFDVRFIHTKDYPFMHYREGEFYLRDGDKRRWLNDDLQSFTPLRFMPPELMNYEGRAVVVDPDVFAVGDVWELLTRDMQGMAIMCRPKSGSKGKRGCLATSVMLLDCVKLSHWQVEKQFGEMFEFKRDYMDWVCLKLDDRNTIGFFEDYWNDFDHFDDNTRLLHNTKRKTQPWKTGLPVDFRPADTFQLFPPKHWFRHARRVLFGDYSFSGRYKVHPDPRQEQFFFGLLRECLEQGIVTEEMLRDEMNNNHLRHDALDLVRRLPPQTD